MLDFSVVERAPGTGGFHPGAAIWRTCLREIAFVDAGVSLPGSGRRLSGEAAYSHLLDVICGLGSPMVGETEVMHQFKAFLATLPPEHDGLRQLGQRLLADARAIRGRHLIGLGSRTYGSAVRRYVQGASRVAIVGTGMLALEILPYVADDNRAVDLWGRRPSADIRAAGVSYRRLAEIESSAPPIGGRTEMVIAAPVSAEVIASLASRYADVMQLIDLRAEAAGDPPPPVAPIVTLQQIFDEVERAAGGTQRHVSAAQDEIRRCAVAYAAREKLRPSGWHDLCA